MVDTIYRPLDREKGEIRLLVILRSLLPSSQLHCVLRQVPLISSPQYEALSYVWGDQTTKTSIVINNEQVKIGFNLWAALFHLRRKSKRVILWCDAICINQKDKRERSHQILRMPDIYTQAQRVVIWLGEEENRSDLAIKNIRLWSRTLGSGFEEMLPSLLVPGLMTRLFHGPSWEACSYLFRRPWWRRVWVVQEVVVSRDAILICGSNSCDWLSFSRARVAWEALKNPRNFQYLTEGQVRMLCDCNHDVAIVMLLTKFNRSELHKHPLSLIRLMNTSDATDPRDKLYALLGLGIFVDISIVPDYEKSVPEVFSDFVRSFVRDKHRISVVAGAGIGTAKPHPNYELPSWVPDLRWFSMFDDYSSFDAAGSTDAVVSFSSDSRFLSSQGIICCDIELLEARPERDVLGRTSWVDLILSQGRSLHPTGIPQIQAYFRTLICDSSNHALCPSDFQDIGEAERFYNLAAGFLYIFGSLLPDRSELRPSPRIPDERLVDLDPLNDYAAAFAIWEGVIPNPPSEEAILEPFLGSPKLQSRLHWPLITEREKGRNCRFLFAEVMGQWCRDRSLFLTKDGYMGLVPPGARENDLVCVLPGCELPIVIRKVDDEQYLLVGSCYIYGMMHGEVMKDFQDGQYHFQNLKFQ